MFHLGQQALLDAFSAGRVDLAEVEQACARTGDGYAVEHYSQLLVAARALKVPVQAGFVSREVAQVAFKESVDVAVDRAPALYGLPRDFYRPGTDTHFAYFRQLLADAASDSTVAPSPRVRSYFNAQVLKDSAMAWRIRETLRTAPTPECRVLAICGTGHVDYRHGVPERVDPPYPAFVITTRAHDEDADEDGVADCILTYTPEPLDPAFTLGERAPPHTV